LAYQQPDFADTRGGPPRGAPAAVPADRYQTPHVGSDSATEDFAIDVDVDLLDARR
jgi:hypothetical protein